MTILHLVTRTVKISSHTRVTELTESNVLGRALTVASVCSVLTICSTLLVSTDSDANMVSICCRK